MFWPHFVWDYDYALEIANGAGFVLVTVLGVTLTVYLFAQIRERSWTVIWLTIGMILVKIGLAIGLGYRWIVSHCHNVNPGNHCDVVEHDAWLLFVSVVVIGIGGLTILRMLSRPDWRPWSWLGAMVVSLLVPFFYYTSDYLFPMKPIEGAVVPGFFHYERVALSVLMAILGSYTALELACHAQRRRRQETGRTVFWTVSAALVMGGSIWSMHFIGMLAYELPGIPMEYDYVTTMISFAFPTLLTLAAFLAVSSRRRTIPVTLFAGVLIAVGVVGMHYTGMAALRIPLGRTFDPMWVLISFAVALVGAMAAVVLVFTETTRVQRIIGAVIMGVLGISGLHYSAMMGFICFHDGGDRVGRGLSAGQLTFTVASLTVAILAAFLLLAKYERDRVERLAH